MRLRVNGRARRISLRIDRARREVVASAPSLHRLSEAADFAKSRAAWIAARMAELPQPSTLAPGQVIEVFGQPVRLASAEGRARWIAASADQPTEIRAMGEGEGFARAVKLLIRKQALNMFEARSAHYAGRLGAATPKVAVTDTTSRWGSCTPARPGGAGSIRYSWRLALAPFAVADYVAAHECAHLLEANHGPKFWAHVRALVGDERPHRAWLRAHGAALHAFGAQQGL
ncbi:SprT family zinc-dependent metalloprotease [Phenylobacterium immobile]|uniref:M48 family metallopeptidase n=1 Tax=Phenylobacterium immobile TaxID=21 RepID=UPI00316ABDB0